MEDWVEVDDWKEEPTPKTEVRTTPLYSVTSELGKLFKGPFTPEQIRGAGLDTYSGKLPEALPSRVLSPVMGVLGMTGGQPLGSQPINPMQSGAETISAAQSPGSLALQALGAGSLGLGKKVVPPLVKPFREAGRVASELETLGIPPEVGSVRNLGKSLKSGLATRETKELGRIGEQAASNVLNLEQASQSTISDVDNILGEVQSEIFSKSTKGADAIKSPIMKFMKTISDKFESGFNGIDDAIEISGNPIYTKDAIKMMGDVRENLFRRGMDVSKIDDLIAKYKSSPEGIVKFSQLRSDMSGLRSPASKELRAGIRYTPQDASASIANDAWRQFIQPYLPDSAKTAYNELMAYGQKVLPIRNKASEIFEPLGEFSTKRGTAFLKQFAEKQIDEGSAKLANALENGIAGYMDPMGDITSEIKTLGTAKRGLEKGREAVETSTRLGKKQIGTEQKISTSQTRTKYSKLKTQAEKNLTEELNNLFAWKQKRKELEELLKKYESQKKKIMIGGAGLALGGSQAGRLLKMFGL